MAGYYGFTLDVRVSIHRVSVVHPSIRISFPDDNLSKHQWIFTKFGMCIDIVKIWFGIANGQISSNFDRVTCPRDAHISFPDDNLNKYQGILTKFDTCIDMKEILFGIFNGQISPMFDRVICPRHENGGVLSFNVFIFQQKCAATFLIFP